MSRNHNIEEEDAPTWTIDTLQAKLEDMIENPPPKGTPEYRKHRNEYTKLAILFNQLWGMRAMKEKL